MDIFSKTSNFRILKLIDLQGLVKIVFVVKLSIFDAFLFGTIV